MNQSLSESQLPLAQNNRRRYLGFQIAKGLAGSALATTAALGLWHVYQEGFDGLEQRIDYNVGTVTPSDGMANAFDAATKGTATIGILAIGYQGAKQIKFAFDPKASAVNQIAMKGRKGNKLRRTLAASGIIVLGGTMIGFLQDVGNAVGDSQTDALRPLVTEFGADTQILSSSNRPELSTSPFASNAVVEKLFAVKAEDEARADAAMTNPDSTVYREKYGSVDLVPVNYSWGNVTRKVDADAAKGSSKPTPKTNAVIMGLPAEVTNLKDANNSCTNIPINAPESLGNKGDIIQMDGLSFIIAGTLKGAGANMVPVQMNSDSYRRCLATNPELPANVLAIKGNQEEIDRLLKDTKVLQEADLSKRVKQTSLESFIEETDRTSKASTALVLFVGGIAIITTAVTVGVKTKNDMTESRGVNSMLAAGGISNKQIAEMFRIKADHQALMASIYSFPLTAFGDYMITTGTPGANIAPNALTFLSTYGLLFAIGRISTEVVAPNEVHKLNPAKRGTQ